MFSVNWTVGCVVAGKNVGLLSAVGELDCLMVGSNVGNSVGLCVEFLSVGEEVGSLVVGAPVVGAFVVGNLVVGFSVVGAFVVGDSVVGFDVVGIKVVGKALGSFIACIVVNNAKLSIANAT